MRAIADIAERLGHDDIRVAHEQDIVLPHVRTDRLVDVYDALAAAGLASASAGLLTDMIACPGLDYCNLANARSISVAAALHAAFSDASLEDTVGPLHINISGCINACGHHHVGHIGILGVDKKGEEFYQITFGGRADEDARIGDIAGPALRHDDVAPAVRRVIDRYIDLRISDRERFIEVVQRLGSQPFAEALYAAS
jgi:sulfite reductase (NADPH) hemoprotein beta-component